ncbi:hypothetical protein NPA07_04655 [Mycoplasmopsis caviae]|uniref:Uncharacterized protein n=1 Tax=Mycoplasmopsis caviae TaxID=55603 RepID=A0ABY5IY75_9BACT|nr:hypothetical protein [Mycoplasmopsis caviae]UUD35068.1 hypothetical protein NPA07_04655 [Mycoplasmopsis caviae]
MAKKQKTIYEIETTIKSMNPKLEPYRKFFINSDINIMELKLITAFLFRTCFLLHSDFYFEGRCTFYRTAMFADYSTEKHK